MRERQTKLEGLIKEILGDRYMRLDVSRIYLEEDLRTGHCSVRCELQEEGAAPEVEPMIIAGEGVGFLDAFFRAVCNRLAMQYPSIESIELASFDIRADLATRDRRFGADAEGEVQLEVLNSEGRSFVFTARSRSITASTAEACLRAAEYFVNGELAYITIYRALLDAQERRRHDLEARYTQQLGELVHSTSYTKVIEEIRKKLEG